MFFTPMTQPCQHQRMPLPHAFRPAVAWVSRTALFRRVGPDDHAAARARLARVSAAARR